MRGGREGTEAEAHTSWQRGPRHTREESPRPRSSITWKSSRAHAALSPFAQALIKAL